MNRSKRAKQDALIVLAILIVILLLWRLRIHAVGGTGGWATTNIFGPVTLNAFSNNETGGGSATTETPQPTNVLAPSTNTPIVPSTNEPHGTPPRPPHQTLSTNLLNTNGPVTVIDVPTSDLVQTPPGVTAAPNSPEATSIEERLGAASAQGGDIQISLYWNNYNDLDLHCVDPSGEEIMFNNRISRHTHGELDVDRNANYPFTLQPVENIYWPVGGAPPGLYRIFVVYYAPHGSPDPTPFTVRTVVKDWKTYYFKSDITYTGGLVKKTICTLRYDPHNPDPDKRFGFVR